MLDVLDEAAVDAPVADVVARGDMVEQGSGVILAVTSGTVRAPSPGMGNTGPADAAVEVFMRTLAAETGLGASASSASTRPPSQRRSPASGSPRSRARTWIPR
ncbi:MAG: hypothetical protein ACR2H2_12010 [Solirubrobacteraceae bacterium]